ncbi:ground-like domain protein [Cooperia oncophora]
MSHASPVGFIENLGAKIEAEEAERMSADGENPLKYLVKDGILYKKNRTPVARISLVQADSIPLISNNFPKITRSVPTQTMVESSPVIAEQAMWQIPGESNQTRMKQRRHGFRPPTPLGPPTVKLPRSSPYDVKKWRGEGGDRKASILSRTVASDNLMEDPDVIMNDLINLQRDPPPYPFSHCYMNIDGFMCCNRFLESLMRKSYRKLRMGQRFNECSVQRIANRIQSDSERVFNTTFETVVGIDDFAIRAHFAGDLMCKIQEGGRFITNYATMMPSRVGVKPDPLAVVTNMEMNTRESDKSFPEPIPVGDLPTVEQLDGAVQHVQVPDQQRPRIEKEDIPYHEKTREDIANDNLINR